MSTRSRRRRPRGGRERGEIARDPVVAEGGDEADAGALGLRPVVLEDAADEGGLPGGVDVRGLGVDRSLHRRIAEAGERTDGGDHRVARLEQGADARRIGDVGDGGLEPAELLPHRLDPLPGAAASTGRSPRATEASTVSRPVYPVAPKMTIRPAIAAGTLSSQPKQTEV